MCTWGWMKIYRLAFCFLSVDISLHCYRNVLPSTVARKGRPTPVQKWWLPKTFHNLNLWHVNYLSNFLSLQCCDLKTDWNTSWCLLFVQTPQHFLIPFHCQSFSCNSCPILVVAYNVLFNKWPYLMCDPHECVTSFIFIILHYCLFLKLHFYHS